MVRLNEYRQNIERMKGEALLYAMINHADSVYRLENVSEQERESDIQYKNFTVSQKIRWHNNILRKARELAKQADKSEYSYDVLIDAFFSEEPGSNYANKIDEWRNPNSLNRLTNNDVRKRPLFFLRHIDDLVSSDKVAAFCSPYDSRFAEADEFQAQDSMGYILASKVQDANGVIDEVNIRERGVIDDSAHIADNFTPLYGDDYNSGYSTIEKYTNPQLRLAVRRRLNEIKDTYGGRARIPEQYEFMEQTCEYLASKGIRFGIKIDGQGNICAQGKGLGGDSMTIRLLDPAHPNLRGRIFNGGSFMNVTIDSNEKDDARRQQLSNDIVTNEDCLNAIKWYMGDEVPVRNFGVVNIGDYAERMGYDGSSSMNVRVTQTRSTRNANNSRSSVLLAVDTHNGREVPIKLMISPSSYSARGYAISGANSLSNEIKANSYIFATDDNFSKDESRIQRYEDNINLYNRLTKGRPEENKNAVLYPEDLRDTPMQVKLNDGKTGDIMFKTGTDIMALYKNRYMADGEDEATAEKHAKDTLEDHVTYYRHLAAREKLNDWVVSAKQNHAANINIDYMVSEYHKYVDKYGSNPDNYVFNFSAEPDIRDLQRSYWQFLNGQINKLTFDGIEGLDEYNADFSVEVASDAPLEDRVAAIKQHYAEFQNEFFGFVPEIVRDELNIKQIDNPGIDVYHVAQYMVDSNSSGTMSNINNIETIMHRLDDDYDDSFIKSTDSYSTDIKNAMIKFDENRIVARLSLNDIISSHVTNGYRTYAVDEDKLKDIENKSTGSSDIKGLQNKPFTRDMLLYMGESFMSAGCDPETIQLEIDEQGIVRYQAYVPLRLNISESMKKRDRQIIEDLNKYARGELDSYPQRPRDFAYKQLAGTLGQIAEPGVYGEIKPATRVDNNKIYIPGYDAYFVEHDADNQLTDSERLRCIGYKQQMQSRISRCVRDAVFTLKTEYNEKSHTTSLNTVYKNMNKMPEDAEHFYQRIGRDVDLDAITDPVERRKKELSIEFYRAYVDTFKNRIRFPNEYADDAASMFELMRRHPELDKNNFDFSMGDLCGNIRCLGNTADVCDELATGVGSTQGIVRFLNEGVVVNDDGTVTPSDKRHCALFNTDMFKYTANHDPSSRTAMAISAVHNSVGIDTNVGIVLMSANGYNLDDGFVISSDFAERNQIEVKEKDENGNPIRRPLKVGDKISDLHGNKGTIACVVDRNAEVDENDYNANLVKFFKENPSVDVVGTCNIGRANGGTIMEMHDNQGDVVLNGEQIKGGMGHVTILIEKQNVTDKTNDESRNTGAQLMWIPNAQNTRNITLEWYHDNTRGMRQMREYLIALGLDMDPLSRVRSGYVAQPGEHRRLIKMPEQGDQLLDIESLLPDDMSSFDITKFADKMDAKIADVVKSTDTSELVRSGGFLEVPFKLNFTNNNTDQIRKRTPQDLTTLIDNPDACNALMETNQTYDVYGIDNNGNTSKLESKPTYGVPILPPSMRSGRSTDGNSSSTTGYNYDSYYNKIYRNGQVYRCCEGAFRTLQTSAVNGLSDENKNKIMELLMNKMNSLQKEAQSSLDYITTDIMNRRINHKSNVVTEGFMKQKLTNAATAVWTADPSLDIDNVAMSLDMAKAIGAVPEDATEIPKDTYTLVWRDPAIGLGALRYMEIKQNDKLEGIAIHPQAAKSFLGDFDGDSVGLNALRTFNARHDAFNHLTMGANLLDMNSHVTIVDEKGIFGKPGAEVTVNPLYTSWDMDAIAAQVETADNDEKTNIKKLRDDLTLRVNKFEQELNRHKLDTGEFNPDDIKSYTFTAADGKFYRSEGAIRQQRKAFVKEASDISHMALRGVKGNEGVGRYLVRVDTPQDIYDSMNKIVSDGAKGNPESLKKYLGYIGINVDEDGKADWVRDENGKICSSYVIDGTIHDKVENEQNLTAIKADFTGAAGSGTKQCVGACRNMRNGVLGYIIDFTQQITQGLMAAKKSADEGLRKAHILQYYPDILNGNKLANFDNPDIEPEVFLKQPHDVVTRNQNGKPCIVKCRDHEWLKQIQTFANMYGIDYNKQGMEVVADALKNGDGFVSGVKNYMAMHGTLEDNIGYGGSGAYTNLVAAAKCGNKGVFENLGEFSKEYIKSADEVSHAKVTYKHADNQTKYVCRANLRTAQNNLAKIVSAATNNVTHVAASVYKRAADFEAIEKEKDESKRAELVKNFEVVCDKASVLLPQELDEGAGFMGESQQAYEARRHRIIDDDSDDRNDDFEIPEPTSELVSAHAVDYNC